MLSLYVENLQGFPKCHMVSQIWICTWHDVEHSDKNELVILVLQQGQVDISWIFTMLKVGCFHIFPDMLQIWSRLSANHSKSQNNEATPLASFIVSWVTLMHSCGIVRWTYRFVYAQNWEYSSRRPCGPCGCVYRYVETALAKYVHIITYLSYLCHICVQRLNVAQKKRDF